MGTLLFSVNEREFRVMGTLLFSVNEREFLLLKSH